MILANVVLLLGGAAVSAAQDSSSEGATCTTKAQRRAWYVLWSHINHSIRQRP